MDVDAVKQLEQEIKELIVSELGFEDLGVDEIDSNMSLFGGGLGLSSINALTLDTALQKRFSGKAADGGTRRLGTIDLFRYSTVRLLAEHLEETLSATATTTTSPSGGSECGARRRAALEQKIGARNR